MIFINAAPPEERVKLLKPMNEIEKMDDESEEVHFSGLLNQYMKRLNCLENITLADWTALYDSPKKPFVKKSRDIDTVHLTLETADDEENDDELPDYVNEAMQNTKQSKQKQCLKPRIITSVLFNVKSHPEKHYHELIMLFTSWRSEETDLIGNSPSYQECFLLLKDKIEKQIRQYAICSEDFNEIEEQLHKCRLR